MMPKSNAHHKKWKNEYLFENMNILWYVNMWLSILKERIHWWWCYYVCLFGLVHYEPGHWCEATARAAASGQEPTQYLPQFSCPWPSPGQAWEWEHKGNWQLRHGKLGQRRKKQSPDTFKKGLHFVNTGPPVVASFRAGPCVAALVLN